MSESITNESSLAVAKTAKTSLLATRQQLNEDDTYEEAEGATIVTDLNNTSETVITVEEAFPLTVASPFDNPEVSSVDHSLEGYWDSSIYDNIAGVWPAYRTNNSTEDSTFEVPATFVKPPTVSPNIEINARASLGFNGAATALQYTNAGGCNMTYLCMLVQFQDWEEGSNVFIATGGGTPYVTQDQGSPNLFGFGGVINSAATIRSLPFDRTWFFVEFYTDRATGSGYSSTICITNLKTGESSTQQDLGENVPGELGGMILGATNSLNSSKMQIAALAIYSSISIEDSNTFPEAQRDLIKAYLTQQFGGIALPLVYTDAQNGTANDNPEEILD